MNTDIYLKGDILLLAAAFECFRNLCMNIYPLDVVYYITAPSLGCASLLKITKIYLEMITDINMHLYIERGIRGELSNCVRRHIKANNKYMKNVD